MPSSICFNLDQSKILSSGNGLTNDKTMNSAKSEAITDDEIKEDEIMFPVFHKAENFPGKWEKM